MLGVRLKYLRKSNNKTQQDIADILGITRPAYTAYEQGKRNPDYEILEKIADYYNVSIDYLLGRTDNKDALHKQAGISDDDYNSLNAYQKEVIDFFLTRENLFFKNQPENLLDALEQFEVYYEVWKKQQENKK
ncbi:helix-turn-helix domain-containing protein [Lysinibacillus fusiformis]|uniref:helix-turn-helix domain-containing protein n=1 Tax=Lysinibacillus fusiformis TaxID=28031 RepID=UPI000887AA6D|nr:helix-turn-helix transcriptional regulator [Lysinibacillus fusiformis]SCX52277.1 Transcriptional regulator, contains XRE-family HTH domain [Lysinibacillus fusiformis]SDB27526.1 Transcriptional regulator, contains XRE-family HTH domain [Lysinibacillus fusiformis]SFI21304.1 Transcriptional regulator, contains XRE-family HTH domain [Lysinibacillus fusiformis]SFS81540.1 Transcriptional regulator, contains XRE-family HTH domain [Lysinibacillus fusiformis]